MRLLRARPCAEQFLFIYAVLATTVGSGGCDSSHFTDESLADSCALATRLMNNSEIPGQRCLPSENALPTTGWRKGKAAAIHDGCHVFMEYTLDARLLGFYLLNAFCMPGSDLSSGMTHLTFTATPSL